MCTRPSGQDNNVHAHEQYSKGTNTRSVSVHGTEGVWSLETSDSKYLWNIGTEANPVIQGQAGKPFYHAPGGCIQLPFNSVPISNDCLCHYPYMQYFWVYAKLVHKDNIQFLDLDDILYNARLSDSSSETRRTVRTFSDSGW